MNDAFRAQPLSLQDYAPDCAVFRTRNPDSKERLWFVLDRSLVLPEFLVEFEYKWRCPFRDKFCTIG